MNGLGTYKKSNFDIKNGVWQNGKNIKIYDDDNKTEDDTQPKKIILNYLVPTLQTRPRQFQKAEKIIYERFNIKIPDSHALLKE